MPTQEEVGRPGPWGNPAVRCRSPRLTAPAARTSRGSVLVIRSRPLRDQLPLGARQRSPSQVLGSKLPKAMVRGTVRPRTCFSAISEYGVR